MTPDVFAAELLEQGVEAYAAAAAEHLVARQPATDLAQGRIAFVRFKQHFVQRILELAAAVGSGESRLFVSRILWSRSAMQARGFAADDAEESLAALRHALRVALPERARVAPLECIDLAVAALSAPPEPDKAALDPRERYDRLALAYLLSVLEGDAPTAISDLIAATRSGLTIEAALLDVLMRAQQEIGRLWQLNEITVGEEHLVTATTERAMAVLAAGAPRRPDRGRTAVAAAVAGNPHEVGIRALAYLLELDGWRTIHLGNDVPCDDLPSIVRFFDADLVLLSCALSEDLRALRETIRALRAQTERPVRIMVGGYVFRDASGLWRDLGADGYAPDGRSAVKLAAELAGGQ